MKKISLISTFVLLAILFVGCKPKTIADLPSQYVTLEDGSKMHYKVYGSGGITLLFVHGFGCDMNVWEKQFEGYSHDTIRMIFVDLPGYGLSDKPHTDYTLDYFADAVKHVIDTLNINRVVLVGHSLGTPVCRQVVFKYPEVSVALCDVDGVYCFYPEGAYQRSQYEAEVRAHAETFKGDSCRASIEQLVEWTVGPFTPDEIIDYASSTMPETPEYVAYSTMLHIGDTANWTGEKINIPTLIICTRNSDLPDDNKQKMDDLYNCPTYVELVNSGHFVMLEDVGLFNNLLERCYEKWKVTEL